VALPIAFSSPYPNPVPQDWSVNQAVTQPAPQMMMLASASSVPVVRAVAPARSAPLVNSVRTVSFRRPDSLEQDVELPDPEPRIQTASLGDAPVTRGAWPRALPGTPTIDVEQETRSKHYAVSMDEIDQYLWSVYQRSSVKRDRSGDFTWKDPAAAKKAGMTMPQYVIQGVEPDLRELLYHAGKAMDAEGIQWTIVSAFRDDYRQSLASGLKARTGYSRHGGSKATGGYGHGRAIDIGHADGRSSGMVFRWIDANGARYGIARPIRHFDPPHVEPRYDWRRIAATMRTHRTGSPAVAVNDEADEIRPARGARTRVASRGHGRRGRRFN
jgi:hypothetical protein